MISHTKVRTRSLVIGVAVLLAASSSLTSCQKVTGGRYAQEVFKVNGVDQIEQVATAETYRTAIDFDTKQNIELKLDIWQPKNDPITDPRPVQMWMHGGAWTKGSGTRASIQGYAQDAASRGYIGVTISYRLRNAPAALPGSALDAYDDAVAAVQWLKDNAARFRLDPNAIIVGGYSAGSINAMNLVYPPYERSQPSPPASPVLGAIGIAGQNMGIAIPNRPPVIMFSATDDHTVPYSSVSTRCAEDRDVASTPPNICTLVTYPSGDHYIAYSRTDEIQGTAAQFAMDTLLPRAGYYLG